MSQDTFFSGGVPDINPVNLPKDPRQLVVGDLGKQAAVRMVFDGANARPIRVPTRAEYFCAFAETGNSRLEIDGVADEFSTIIVHEDGYVMMYPILPGQSLSGWGAAGAVCSIRFLGRMVQP